MMNKPFSKKKYALADLRDEDFNESEDLNHMEGSDSAYDPEAPAALCACALSGL